MTATRPHEHSADGGDITVVVRFFASARAAAGVEHAELLLPRSPSLEDVLRELRQRYPEQLTRVLHAASFLIDGMAARDREVTLHPGAQVDVLPPFAGG